MNGIKKAINQRQFSSEYHQSVVSIIYISNLIKNHYHQIFKSYDITIQQFNILRILRGSNPTPCSIGLLKERMLDKMSDASRLVDRLVKLGFAKRKENKIDRRVMEVSITKKGLELLTEIDKYNPEFDKILNVISEKDAKVLNQILDKIIDANSDNRSEI